ncbi:NAD(P)H-binding protein [Hymenobacter sp. 15J16-1T3B]|uniref:SDR family oxidoreductase n=1 Tax=Hymenobacter sp. 15J16-1T3B TaxID=2886941 RepID=UPI001D105546|nr:NAD(P)H-binding protein [Hymenobacter sp. 15J16-1T3B]MCC3157188.1 NAD(P)H-binding protein [Hymenobacter sp. 15J16-1T3B]
MDAVRKVLVIGATGMIGRPVTAELVAAGFEVTALVRDAARARPLLPAAVRLTAGDVADAASLRAALTGQDAVYLNLSVRQTERENEFHPELQGLEHVLEEARAAGVRRVLYLSSLIKDYAGFRWWVFELKKQAAERVRRSGVPYTIFHPSAFMETLVNTQLAGPFILVAGQARHPMHWVSGRDYGRQVAAALRLPAAANHEYVVQGPQALTTLQAAREVARHHGRRRLRVAYAPLGLIKLFGRLLPRMNYGYHLIEALNEMPEPFGAEATWQELGPATETLRDFAARQ